MGRSGKSSRTWRVIINDPRLNIVAFAILSYSFCAKMIPSGCSLESLSVARYDGKICHPWGRKFVTTYSPYFRPLNVERKTSRYIAGSFFNDTTGIFKTRVNENAPGANGDAQLATSTLQVAMTAGQKTQWLMLGRPQGVVEVSSCHVILSFTNRYRYRLCVDLDPPQVNFSVLNYRDCIHSESPSRFI